MEAPGRGSPGTKDTSAATLEPEVALWLQLRLLTAHRGQEVSRHGVGPGRPAEAAVGGPRSLDEERAAARRAAQPVRSEAPEGATSHPAIGRWPRAGRGTVAQAPPRCDRQNRRTDRRLPATRSSADSCNQYGPARCPALHHRPRACPCGPQCGRDSTTAGTTWRRSATPLSDGAVSSSGLSPHGPGCGSWSGAESRVLRWSPRLRARRLIVRGGRAGLLSAREPGVTPTFFVITISARPVCPDLTCRRPMSRRRSAGRRLIRGLRDSGEIRGVSGPSNRYPMTAGGSGAGASAELRRAWPDHCGLKQRMCIGVSP